MIETKTPVIHQTWDWVKALKRAVPDMKIAIVGDHVTLESGTGCVHTAPGHGVEDFEVCKKYPDVPVIVPVDNTGRMTAEAGEICAGMTTDEANKHLS